MSRINWSLVGACVVVAALVIALFSVKVQARDLGQWNKVDPEISSWYRSLKQPDTGISCCGESDSYFCDEHARGDQIYCVIDDDRDDAALMRKHVDNGTEILIPPHKLNKDPNPVGHGVVFLSTGGWVYCFIGLGGV